MRDFSFLFILFYDKILFNESLIISLFKRDKVFIIYNNNNNNNNENTDN